jgi:hypothetical protein
VSGILSGILPRTGCRGITGKPWNVVRDLLNSQPDAEEIKKSGGYAALPEGHHEVS